MNLIAAVDQNWAIGKDGDQLCYIPADLKRFRALTTGHAVILGRKTLATFPGGKPLKNRPNLILSRNPAFAPQGAQVFRDVDSLLAAAPADAFVIGGESVYQALLPHCDRAFITKIHRAWPADAFFPDLDASSDWRVVEEGEPLDHEGLCFHYVTYERVK